MRKRLLIATLIALASSSAFAYVEDAFYLKGEIGALRADKNNFTGQGDKKKGIKFRIKEFEPKISPVFGAGVGYNISEVFAVDLTYHYNKNERTAKATHKYTEGGKKVEVNDGKLNHTIHAVLLNGNIRVCELPEIADLYLNAGIGMSSMSGNVTGKMKVETGKNTNITFKHKAVKQLAWKVSVGLDWKLGDVATLSTFAGYADFGKPSGKSDKSDKKKDKAKSKMSKMGNLKGIYGGIALKKDL